MDDQLHGTWPISRHRPNQATHGHHENIFITVRSPGLMGNAWPWAASIERAEAPLGTVVNLMKRWGVPSCELIQDERRPEAFRQIPTVVTVGGVDGLRGRPSGR